MLTSRSLLRRADSAGASNRFRDAVVLTAGANIAIMVVAAVSGLVLARMLGAADRGAVAALTTCLLVAATIGECGLTFAVCYFVARRPEEAADHIRTALRLMLALGSAAAVAGILLSPLISGGDGHYEWLFRVSFLSEPLLFAGGVWMFALQALHLPSWNRARLVQPLVYAAGVLLFALLGVLSVASTIAALVLSTAAQAAVARSMCRRRVVDRGRARRRLLRPMLRYGASNLLATSPSAINVRLDQFVLAFVGDPADLGRYAVAVSLSGLVCPLALAFGHVAMPRIAASDPGSPRPAGLVWGALAGSAAVGAGAAALLCLATPLLVGLLGPSFAGMSGLVWMLAPAMVAFGCNRVMGDVLRGFGRPLDVARAEGVAAGATVVLLATTMPAMGVYGAAVASLGAYLIAAAVLVRAVRRELAVRPSAVTTGLEPAASVAVNLPGAGSDSGIVRQRDAPFPELSALSTAQDTSMRSAQCVSE